MNHLVITRLFYCIALTASLSIALGITSFFAYKHSNHFYEEPKIFQCGVIGEPDFLNYKNAEQQGIRLNSTGEALFKQNCRPCHSFERVGVGPNLKDAHLRLPEDALIKFISNPEKEINSGDPYLEALFEQYRTFMPAFENHLSPAEIDSVISYIRYESAIRN